MSLRVWLPLNGTLENKGLDDITPVLIGAVAVDNEGKIGKCYKFGTSLGRITIPPVVMRNYTECSVTFWVNILGWQTNWDTFFQAGLGTSPWNSYTFGVLRNQSNHVVFAISDGSTSSQGYYKSSDLALNTWHHLAFTYKAGHCCIYVNGILFKDYATAIVPKFSNITYVSIGQLGNAGSYQTNCKMNDFRIYDHALSPLEIKQISQGLVLHYPLNRGGFGQENLFNWSDNATGITLNDYQNKGSFTQFTNSLSFNPSTTVGKKYTISFWAKSPNGTTSLLLYNNNSKPKYFNFSTTLTSNLGTEWQFFKYTVTNIQYTGSDASTNTNIWKRIEIYAPHQMKVQVKQIKVEEGEIATPWCPNSTDALATTIGLNDNVEYDTSGYGNNGTRMGTFSWTSDTPKYNVSQYFNNSTGTSTLSDKIYISASPNLYSPSAITVGFWFKKEAITRGGLFTTGPATTSTTILAIHDYDSGVKVISSDNTTLSMGSYDTFIPSTNIWYYYVITFDGTNAKIYINGDLKTTKSYSGIKTLQNIIDITLGANSAGGVYRSAKGYYSDFRIYATALSAEDVLSLYQNSAYIDNQGNIYGAVYEEV